jgi:WD40 repeat protein
MTGVFLAAAIVSPFGSLRAELPADERQDKQALSQRGAADVVAYATDAANAVAVSSDGKYVAAGGMDKSVKVWKLDSGELVHEIEGSQGIIRAIAFQPHGPLLATGGDEPVVRIWDASTGERRKVLRGVRPTVTSITFSPDGRFVAGCSFAQTGAKGWLGDVIVWDVESGDLVRVVESQANGYYRGVAFSPDGSLLAAAFDAAGSPRSSGVKLWDSRTWELKGTLLRDRGASLSVAFSPDGRYVASGGGYVEVNDGRTATGEVTIWDIETGKIVETLSRPTGGGYVAVAFSPDGAIAGQGFGPTVATKTTSSVISEVTIWNPATREPTWNARFAFCGDPSPPAFSPDGMKLVTCDSEAVRVLDADQGETLRVLMRVKRMPISPRTDKGSTEATRPTEGDERPEALPPRRSLRNGKDAAKARAAHVRDIATGSRHAEDIAFTSDGKYVVSGGFDCRPATSQHWWVEGKADGVLQVSDLEGGKVLAQFQGTAGAIIGVAISPDDRLVATAGRVRNEPQLGEVKLWDFDTRQERLTLHGHTSWVLSVAFSPDGRLLASGGFDKVARIWEVASGELVAELPQLDSIIDVVAFSPDGKHVATATRRDGSTTLWDVTTWQKTRSFSKQDYFLWDLAFSPDGKWLAMGGVQTIADEPREQHEQMRGLVLLCQLDVEEPAKEIDIAGRMTTSVSFSRDSRWLSTLSMPSSRERPGGVTIYDVTDQSALVHIATGSSSSGDGLRFLPHGRTLATTSSSGTVSLWSFDE